MTRSVEGGAFGLLDGEVRSLPPGPPERVLGATNAGKDSLSKYLLELLGLDGMRLRTNVYNKTRDLSIRDVARLTVIGETKIQSETPPALSGRHTDRTVEISAFKLLLEGIDDSNLEQLPSRNERRQAATAKVEVVDSIIARLQRRLESAADVRVLQDQLNRLNTSIRQQNMSVAKVSDERRKAANQLAQQGQVSADTKKRITDIGVLEARFLLLLAKYESDLARLDMVGEAGTILGLFTPGVCVVCGADPAHQSHNDHIPQDSTNFAESVDAERRKTELLAAELISAIADLRAERERLAAHLLHIGDSIGSLRAAVRRLDDFLAPQTSDLTELADKRSMLESLLSSYSEIAELEKLKVAIEADRKSEKDQASTSLDFATLRRFSDAVAGRLTAWAVPDGGRVYYDRNEQDLVAGDQLRSAHGKGVRAVLHSAFTLGLAEFCYDNGLPHPGFVVVDSPLVTYRPPKPGEAIDAETLPRTVAEEFYSDVERGLSGQVIIMENTDPPQGLSEDSVDVFFSGVEGEGRTGFFPAIVQDRTDPVSG
ncbi:hypothetical protein [Mycolicibacterium sp. CBMA 234]|uniref:hypothetical protein n=1 Tax=Mycolicibacterium sp. CBMA 234 TaxID=1918495 RepID=UPI0012DC2690|nr:hypothetical protein [Mycolicibacterium sp. CBMA 234]